MPLAVDDTRTETDQMVSRRLNGARYREIAVEFGLSHEAVRQRVIAAVGPERAVSRPGSEERLNEAIAAVQRLVAADPAISTADIVAALDYPRQTVLQAARRVPRTPGRRGHRRYTDADLIAALRTVASDGLLSGSTYQRSASSRGLPTRVTIVNRFGTWTRALAAAGLNPTPMEGPPGQRQYPDADILGAVRAAAADGATTFDGYMLWAQQREGRPSGSTVRLRFGTWSAAQRAAMV